MLMYFFSVSFWPSSDGAVEAWHLFQRRRNRLHDEDHWGELHVQLTLLSFGVLLFTERFQIGDIGLIEVGNVRDHRSYGSG